MKVPFYKGIFLWKTSTFLIAFPAFIIRLNSVYLLVFLNNRKDGNSEKFN